MLLVVVMVAITVLAALGAGFLMTSTSHTNRAQVAEEDVKLLNIAEAGVAAAITDLVAGGAGDVKGDFGLGTYTVNTTDDGGGYLRIASSATFGNWTKDIEIVVLATSSATTLEVRAAIEAGDDVTTGGNFTADGRDFDYTNGSLAGPGVFGISTSGLVNRTGSSQIGGNGVAPNSTETQTEQNLTWGDSLDNDADAFTDEELWDGLDNDGDGQIDEDTNGYATDPDGRVGLPPGTLKSAAQGAGTYFTSGAQYDTWIAANGGKPVPGSIIYVEAASWVAIDLGTTVPGDAPSILVCHNSTSTMLMKNIHGNFNGLIVSDYVDHTNGTAMIYGAFLCLSGQLGNAFGNGTATVRYSSNALANLPSALPDGYQKISWEQQ
jgi:hypothetical protein